MKQHYELKKLAREWLDDEFGSGTHDDERAESLALFLAGLFEDKAGTTRVCTGCWEGLGEVTDKACAQAYCPLKE